jgi:hypothetical protein
MWRAGSNSGIWFGKLLFGRLKTPKHGAYNVRALVFVGMSTSLEDGFNSRKHTFCCFMVYANQMDSRFWIFDRYRICVQQRQSGRCHLHQSLMLSRAASNTAVSEFDRRVRPRRLRSSWIQWYAARGGRTAQQLPRLPRLQQVGIWSKCCAPTSKKTAQQLISKIKYPTGASPCSIPVRVLGGRQGGWSFRSYCSRPISY